MVELETGDKWKKRYHRHGKNKIVQEVFNNSTYRVIKFDFHDEHGLCYGLMWRIKNWIVNRKLWLYCMIQIQFFPIRIFVETNLNVSRMWDLFFDFYNQT